MQGESGLWLSWFEIAAATHSSISIFSMGPMGYSAVDGYRLYNVFNILYPATPYPKLLIGARIFINVVPSFCVPSFVVYRTNSCTTFPPSTISIGLSPGAMSSFSETIPKRL